MHKIESMEKEFYQKQSKDWLVRRCLAYSHSITKYDKELQKLRKKVK